MPPTRHPIAPVSEIPPGSRKIVQIGHRSIGVFNVAGEFYAIRNQCPHQGAPLCRGTLSGTMLPAGAKEYVYGLEGRVLRCPWHSWEFDVTTGQMIFVPEPMRVKTYEVAVEPPELERYEVAVEEDIVVLII
ncbi:MAG: Rieske (2Fe-2S) protein [Caldilineaceae bacterium]